MRAPGALLVVPIIAALVAVGQGAPTALAAHHPVPAHRVPAIPSDFDGDGYADLAIGVTGGPGTTEPDAGAVVILHGSRSGLVAAGSQRWTQDSPGLAEDAEERDFFGHALASADFDRDGYADLAIGVPGETPGPNPEGVAAYVGAVQILSGSQHGLTSGRSQLWAPDSPGIAGLVGDEDEYERFGDALSAGDFDGDGHPDLAIGVPYEDVEGAGTAGAIVVLFGGRSGLVDDRAVAVSPASPGFPAPLATERGFGQTLASGDIDGDGCDDLAVGAPGTMVDGIGGAGAVTVLYGGPGGPSTAGSQRWTQASPGIASRPERYVLDELTDASEAFGTALAIGDFDGDWHDDLAIGVPGETLDPRGWHPEQGSVHVLYGTAAGLDSERADYWHRGVSGVPGPTDDGDRFGAALTAGDFDGDGHDELAIGIPGADNGAEQPPGAALILLGGTGGLTARGAHMWTREAVRVTGVPSSPGWYDQRLASANYGHTARSDLAVGAPLESVDDGSGIVYLHYGSRSGITSVNAQVWSQDATGVEDVAGARIEGFGSALSP